MNKKLIKKYKAEFDHWVDEGSLLIKLENGWEKLPRDYQWHNLTNKLIIINDKYAELRKAFAEGRTIQYNPTNTGDWSDIEDPCFTDFVKCYRIKPETSNKPKFKIGDIIHNSDKTWFLKITGVYLNEYTFDILTGGYIKNNVNFDFFDNHFKIWEPNHGDLVAVYDTGHDNFVIIGEYGSKCYNGVTIDEKQFYNIRPYFGQLEDLRV
jgi:hypothetical protein